MSLIYVIAIPQLVAEAAFLLFTDLPGREGLTTIGSIQAPK